MKYHWKNDAVRAKQWTGKNIKEVKKLFKDGDTVKLHDKKWLAIKICPCSMTFVPPKEWLVVINDKVHIFDEETFHRLFVSEMHYYDQ